MSGQRNHVARELGKFLEAFWVELPQAAAREIFGGAQDEISRAGWKAYDAWVGLSNEATNQLYANPLVGALTGAATEGLLRLQHLGNAATTAFFANLWPAVGLPTAAEFAALRSEIAELRDQLEPSATLVERAPAASYSAVREEGLKLVRNAHARRREAGNQDAAA